MPDLKKAGPMSRETHRWLGRAYALVGEAEGVGAQINFQHHLNNFEQYRYHSVEGIIGLLYRALATVEIEVPALAGTFIPAGNTFDAMAAATRIFGLATAELLIVDPYLDEKILTEFALFAPAGITLRRSRACVTSLRFDVGCADHFAPFLRFVGDELTEIRPLNRVSACDYPGGRRPLSTSKPSLPALRWL
jgi:hypothetical protein